ncbi:DUF6596 domain-containing protein [Nonomuraea angiospora]|uniref:RNA polymerase sigma factor n=1 Tax=Nonomuraea angiospora TaxID=46172 RepID=UPI0034206920
MTPPPDVESAVADAYRRGWALVLAATAGVARDLNLAEECVQEAYAAALASWARDGIPNSPEAWLITAARRRAMDAVRREQTFRSKLPLLVAPQEAEDEVAVDEPEDVVPDERLRLIFMCCHPALAQEAQLALTLRLVCGVTTADIARALLVPEPTMAARMTRAKKKISAARIPFRLPGQAELPDRLRAVLGVIHLLFTAGHTAPSGASLMRTDLVDQSVRLARMLRELMPDEREVRGLLALLLVTDARRATRVDDRTDWPQIVTLYDELLSVWPSPVVALNRTVAVSMVSGPAQALEEVAELEKDGRLARYPYLPAIKADLLHRLGRWEEASIAYRQALELTGNDAEREFLAERLAGPRRA